MKPKDIDVVVLCGGRGKRLRSVVSDRPKPMAIVGNRPFIDILVTHVASCGFRRFLLCCGYMSGVIESYFRNRRIPGCSVQCLREERALGTGGALLNAAELLRNDRALVLNGDSFCAVDYRGLIRHHMESCACATITVSKMRSSESYGSVVLGRQGTVLGFKEKACKAGGWVNAGVYVFERKTIRSFPDIAFGRARNNSTNSCYFGTKPFSLELDILPFLAGKGLYAYRSRNRIWDIGTPERYLAAQKHKRLFTEKSCGK